MVKEKRPFCCHKFFVPSGLSAPAWGYIHVKKPHKKKTIKNQTSKRFFLNLQQMGKMIRNFCCHKNFDPKGLSVPALGLYTCIKSFKMCLKSYFKEHFKTCNKWAKWLSVDINICPQGVVCPCPGAIYMYKSIKIYTRTRCQVSIYRTTGPLV